MQFLDVKVLEQAQQWQSEGEPIWLCTVLATYGSSPRSPGALLVANKAGDYVGSLSGGCVEEDFIARIRDSEFMEAATLVRYGEADAKNSPQIKLPCGGILEILVERLTPQNDQNHINQFLKGLNGESALLREVDLITGSRRFVEDKDITGPKVFTSDAKIWVRIGPAAKLIIAGMSPVSEACASFAVTLGFEVIICDPREEAFSHFALPGVTTINALPSLYISQPHGCHSATAIVALTHDPRIDDLAMMDAVHTAAFYIGVMGSHRTSNARAQRLRTSGGLTDEQIARIHMPIGLALGSKTPAEIALAVMADVVRSLRGKQRSEL